jgi:hypothetical protein
MPHRTASSRWSDTEKLLPPFGLRRVPDTEFASDDAPGARRNEVSDACERSAMMEGILEPDA